MLSLARVRRLVVVVAAGALVVASVGSSVPVLALSDGSQSPEIAVEQAEIGTGNSFGVEGPVVAGVSSNFASVLAPKTASVFNPSNTFGTGVTPQIAAGGSHTCALLNTGAVNCWGRNFYGQLGNGTNTDSSVPVAVDHVYRRVGDGGLDHSRQLPYVCVVEHWCRQLLGLQQFRAARQRQHHCQFSTGCGGRVYSRVGDGGFDHSRLLPYVCVVEHGCRQLLGLQRFRAARQRHHHFQFSTGCGGRVYRRSATAVSITAGDYHTCALLNTGAVNCWGYNFDGQLGNGNTTYSSAPVAVDRVYRRRRRRSRSQPATPIRVRC